MAADRPPAAAADPGRRGPDSRGNGAAADRTRQVDSRTVALAVVFAGATALAAFAFGASYTHIYDLGISNGQHRWAAKLTPLSVDLLIVVASAVVFLQRLTDARPEGAAKWLPRTMIYAGIGATLAANWMSGQHWTHIDPYLSAWPAAVFAAVVETVLVAVLPLVRQGARPAAKSADQTGIPANVWEAARIAAEAAQAEGRPLSGYQIGQRFNLTRAQGESIAAKAAEALSVNGAGRVA